MAQPAASAKGDRSYARLSMEAIRRSLLEWQDPAEAVTDAAGRAIALTEPQVEAGCIPAAESDLPLLICHFGPAASQPVAQAIFWHAQGTWQAQLYPQASARVAAERKELLEK
ncbi:MAG TPA: hypothetical protein VD902_04100, partial [Symbiobacteriaceae bacterium]|nr:hypothetical protein [Symbiobacteriaceae bacterium]